MSKTWLQIPNNVIRNPNIDEKAFTIYAYLLFRQFKNFGNKVIEIEPKHIKTVARITNNRVLLKSLSQLYEQNLINEQYIALPRRNKMNITIRQAECKDYFTQLPVELLQRLDEVGYVGFRLMYYYESYINRRTVNRLYSYPSYHVIEQDLNISNPTITKYNKLLSDLQLISITKHKVEADPFGEVPLERYNNHYHVNIENV